MRPDAEDWYRTNTPIRSQGPRVRKGQDLAHVAFPLGGIGTGSISIDGGGRLRDFEIFNRPAKGETFDHTFFTLRMRPDGGAPLTQILQGPLGGRGLAEDALAEGIRRSGVGLPHFRETEFSGRFPIAEIQFRDPDVLLDVKLEAFNPFIPLEPDDSGLPMAWFVVSMFNPLDVPVEVVLYANLQNRLGHPSAPGGMVEYVENEKVRGLRMSSSDQYSADSAHYGTMMLATPHRDVVAQTSWQCGSWFDGLQDFWDQVDTDDFRESREPAHGEEGCDIGTIGLKDRIPAGGSIRLPIWLAWHTPNFEKYWDSNGDPTGGAKWRNHYALRFVDATAVVEHVADSAEQLEAHTRAFAEALWTSTLPEAVLDAVSTQLSTLKTTTCLRLEDGTFWGWEGCDTTSGKCAGTTSHVWNYAQALPYLFPSLERSIRDVEYSNNLHDDGHMTFRTPLPAGSRPAPTYHAAADGQLGGVLRIYREWQISGDDQWLRGIWPSVRRSLEYAWVVWDRDRDGVAEGLQHNTYDIQFFGPNPMVGTLYLAALEAAARLADRLDEDEFADLCRSLRRRGSAWMDEHLFNGEYYEQQVRPEAGDAAPFPPSHQQVSVGVDPIYQVGTGCLSDQLIGVWYAFMLDLGPLLEADHVISAARAIFRHNWRSELWGHVNAQRILAHEDEAGLLLATWPRGGRPAVPFPYCDEIWTGIEYEVSALLAYLGLTDEALVVVTACRDRYRGARRNPWSDIESGNHYARGMASYSLLLAYSGVVYSAPDRSLAFCPLVDGDHFQAFFSVGSGWGIVYRSRVSDRVVAAIEVLYGSLELVRATLPLDSVARATIGGQALEPRLSRTDGAITLDFAKPVVLAPGSPLIVAGL